MSRLRNGVLRYRQKPDLGVQARHVEVSAIASADDDRGQPSERLLDIAIAAIPVARTMSMSAITARMTEGPYWPEVWPGEHYKLLAALVEVTGAKKVVEIGTFLGIGSLALLHRLPDDGVLTTFDIVPWQEFPNSAFVQSDFKDQRLTQVVGDITTEADFKANAEILKGADLIFVDAAKDGRQELAFLERFEQVEFVNAPLVVFDDIRVFNMLQIWRDIERPKLDITSFGHWSGTGLVDFT